MTFLCFATVTIALDPPCAVVWAASHYALHNSFARISTVLRPSCTALTLHYHCSTWYAAVALMRLTSRYIVCCNYASRCTISSGDATTQCMAPSESETAGARNQNQGPNSQSRPKWPCSKSSCLSCHTYSHCCYCYPCCIC